MAIQTQRIRDRQARIPMGKPPQWSAERIARNAKITLADIEEADALWIEGAPAKMKLLLRAKPDERPVPETTLRGEP